MGPITLAGGVAQLLRRLPAPVLKMLDAWSYEIAVRHAERRRIRAAIRRGRLRKSPGT